MRFGYIITQNIGKNIQFCSEDVLFWQENWCSPFSSDEN
jgi:hypothetical protein